MSAQIQPETVTLAVPGAHLEQISIMLVEPGPFDRESVGQITLMHKSHDRRG
jgi:hypothetical protein